MKTKICFVVGTRPEAIKMAPAILALKKYPEEFAVSVCSTGQHATMLAGAFAAFGIDPDVEFQVMQAGQSLAQLTAKLLLVLDEYFAVTEPDIVMVHGDTTTAMAGALAAFYRDIDVGHVEAGLRTRNLRSPFPEEFNRCAVSLSARYQFAPTTEARDNLLAEGQPAAKILVTGNTVIDALLYTITDLEQNPTLQQKINTQLQHTLGFDLRKERFVLITAHRRENWGDGLANICTSIKALAAANPTCYFVYPVHLNPNVKNVVEKQLADLHNVVLIPPQDYREFSWLLRSCYLVLTDSGGIQEEAPALGKPVLVMRDTSERPEAITAGTAKLVTTDPTCVISETQRLLDDTATYKAMAQAINPFGDGQAAQRIADYFLSLK